MVNVHLGNVSPQPSPSVQDFFCTNRGDGLWPNFVQTPVKGLMEKTIPITTLFLDVGGVLLTNGWDHGSRELAASTFGLDPEEMKMRHNLIYDIFEVGKISLEEYLDHTVFYEKRLFSKDQFKKFMFAQSKPFIQMIDTVCKLKEQHGLKIIVVSNESRELNDYRIKKFKLASFIDFFISSCFVHLRKPDKDIYRLALDVAHVSPKEAVYIDDRLMFVQAAKELGIQGIHHLDYMSTRAKLTTFGLKVR
jgi:putative hydrolase of the HAD superfamily